MATNKKFEVPEGKVYYKKNNKGELVLDENGARQEISVYNGITLGEMIDWLEENGDKEDKANFKNAYYSYADGTPTPVMKKIIRKGKKSYESKETYQKTNFINAKRHFFKTYAPEFLPVKKEQEKKKNEGDRMKDW